MTIESQLENSTVPEQSEILPHSENEEVKLKENLQILLDSFRRIALISDRVHQEYEITKEARQLDIPLESYRRMFENYLKPNKTPSKFDTVIKPVSLADKKVGDFIAWFQSISIFKLTAVFSQISLLLAMMSFFMDAPRRQQQAIDAARITVESAISQSYSQARINALTTLNQFCVSLTGVNAAKADLENIQMNNCYVQKPFTEMFATWPPKFFKYQGFDLSYANLQNSNLNGANLEGADLRGVNLQGAELIETNLKGANLSGANLEGAKLWRVNLEGANLKNSNLQNSGLGRAHLQGANFEGANLKGAKLYWSNLQGASFLRSNLEGANLSRTKLQGADFYKANLKGSVLRYADLRNGTNLREAELEDANLKESKFWSINQVKRGKNWEKAIKNPDWEAQISNPRTEIFRVGLIKINNESFFDSFQQGMKLVTGEKVEIFTLPSEPGIDKEPQAINKLINDGVDAIFMFPQDTKKSVETIKKAYESGIAVFNLAGCVNESDANKYLFGCYGLNIYQMGYDTGDYLGTWAAKKLPGKEVNLAILDTASFNTSYPFIQGFYESIKKANIPWTEVTSADVSDGSSVSNIREILIDNPQINMILAASNPISDVAVQAVEELGLQGKVFVFSISNLTRDNANKLVNPNNPLESVIDQSGQQVGYQTLKNAISVLNGNVTPYQFYLVKHHLLTKYDKETIEKLLNKTEKDSDLDRKSPVINQQNNLPQNSGVSSTKP
jgi:uncharacterized protein YjbI with pentapeptide repeats/ABC-type sugar transport system substrate-binding protein